MSRLLLLALLILAPVVANASDESLLDRMSDTRGILGEAPAAPAVQSRAAACGPGSVPCQPPSAPPVPLDGGLSLLALAGAGYAAKRLRGRRA